MNPNISRLLDATLEASRFRADRLNPDDQMIRTLASGFLRCPAQFPARPAIDVAGQEVSYQDLARRAMRLAATIQTETPPESVPLTAIFAYRSETAYASVLGALLAGHGYVPLNRTFPVERTRLMLERSTCRSLVVDGGSVAHLEALLTGVATHLLVVCPDQSDVSELALKFPRHRILGAADLLEPEKWNASDLAPDSIAYLLFTSGSTGQPKGVMVSHRNVL